jgi:hypothetical protein
MKGDVGALTERQVAGMNLFYSARTFCFACHGGPEFSVASTSQMLNPEETGIEIMPMADGGYANYDLGFYNTGVRPTAEDKGRGALSPFGSPLSFSRQAVLKAGLVQGGPETGVLNFDPRFVLTPACVPAPLENPPILCPDQPVARVAVDGAFKTPTLRNVELTGPFFHTGGHLTLRQAIDFYNRGGDFNELNEHDRPLIIRKLGLTEAEIDSLIDFLLSLTDERVRWEKAPFDRPELPVPEDYEPTPAGHPKRHGGAALPSQFKVLEAIGAAGRAAEGLGPLRPLLWDGTPEFHWKR